MTGISEEDIRPRKLMARKLSCVEADRAFLLARRTQFVSVRCPACDAESPSATFAKLGFSYCHCGVCGTVYTNPRPSPQILEEFYSSSLNYQYWNEHIFPATEETRRERIFRPRVQRLAEYCARFSLDPDVLLDVGAGFGTFGQEVLAAGLASQVVAIEPTPDLAETCRARGLEVLAVPFEQVSSDMLTADVVTAFEVVEHLFAPREFLLMAHEVIRPGGLLVVTCPNVRGFDVATLGVLSNTIDHEHLNYFHSDSLGALVEAAGFEVVESETPGRLDAELVRNRAITGEIDLASQPFLRMVLIDRWAELGGPFQDFLATHGLSSHMWVVARRPS